MSLRQKSIRGMAWSFTETIGVKIFSVSVYFLLAKLLGPEPFGLVALTSSFIFLSSMVIDQGFVEALIQRKELNRKVLNTAFWGIMLLGVFSFVIIYLFAPFISQVYKESLIIDLLRFHSLNFIIGSSGSVHRALLEREFNFKAIAVGRIAGIVIGGGVSLLMAYKGYGAWCLVIQHIIFTSVQSLTFWISSKWMPSFYFSRRIYKDLFAFGGKIVVSRVLNNFNQYLYNLVIGYFFNASVLGYFSFGLKVFNTISDIIITSANKVLLPLFSGLQDNLPKIRAAFLQSTYYMLFASLPLFSAMVIVVPELIELAYGPDWEQSKIVVQILSLSGVSLLLISIYQSLQIAAGRPEKNIRVDALNLLTGLIGLFILFEYELQGAAWSFVFKYFVTFCYVMWQLHGYLRLNRSFFLSLAKPLGMFLSVTLVIQYLNYALALTPSYQVILSAGLLFMLSLAILYLTMPHLLINLRHRLLS